MPVLWMWLLLLAEPATAAEDWYTECQAIADLAEKFQTYRQSGLPLGKMLEKAGGARAEKELVDLIIKAYQMPIWTPEERERVIAQYAEREHLACIEALRPQ